MKNKEVITKWVAALRSGKYEQTKKFLHDWSGYCCLGVLCDLAVQAAVIPPPGFENGRYTYGKGKTQSNVVPPKEVDAWIGAESYTVHLPNVADTDDGRTFLTTMNDGMGKSFSEIADAIEKEYLTEEVSA
jgi:hypothetical protein